MRKRVENDPSLGSRLFSIYCSSLRDPICMECKSEEQCDRWVSVLNFCVQITNIKNKSYEWFSLKCEWDASDKSQKGIFATLRKANIGITKREISAIFNKLSLSGRKRELSFDEFFEMRLKISHRKEFQSLFEQYAEPCTQEASVEKMSVAKFKKFLRCEQGESHDTKHVIAMMTQVLLKKSKEEMGKNSDLCFTKHDFVSYLGSEFTHPLDQWNLEQTMDMTRPLCDYFIATSHNTYLENYQYKGKSSAEMYVRALQNGCRCVEIDCWDGPNDHPVVYHGYTLTQKIGFGEVIKAIAEHAFDVSSYPLLISLENHCSAKNQLVLNFIFLTTFLQ
ncbi:1-phosphatidylinositol 4,5-bisphosphate phosphodiesterase delta-1, variant 3 [Bonamia ostreae]|uniref:Phosphoinositide phospholipase C n=1 Tax=Bonamia ostreae TaxID=126728 RepID=A0ABV2AN76_9EUKA